MLVNNEILLASALLVASTAMQALAQASPCVTPIDSTPLWSGGDQNGGAVFDGRYIYDIERDAALNVMLTIVDTSGGQLTRVSSRLISTLSTNACALSGAIAIAGDEVYVLTNEGLRVFDVSDRSAPSFVRLVGPPLLGTGCAGNLGVAANDEVVVTLSGGLIQVHDRGLLRVPDPPFPMIPNNPLVRTVPTAPLAGILGEVLVRDHLAVVLTQSDLAVIDLSTPATASIVQVAADTPFFLASHMTLDEDGRLYVTQSFTPILTVFETLSPLATPVPIDPIIGLIPPIDVSADDGFIAIGNSQSGVQLVDIRDPSEPEIVAQLPQDPAFSVTLSNGSLFIPGTDTFDLRWFDVSACLTPAPCSPADLAPPNGSLDFFDVLEYLALFDAQDPAADLAAPFGSFDFFDVLEYLAQFDAGC
ncbi:MAG: GC-type dockerin domain-anchored protein [Planctomycetota bacterium]